MSLSSSSTRYSLLLRLQAGDDVTAWETFVEVYTPVVRRVALRRGMQSADVDNLVQEVWLAVSQKLPEWLEREDRGNFRAWLITVANHQAINLLSRRGSRPIGRGGSEAEKSLALVAAKDELESLIETEYRREVFLFAAQQVRGEVSESTWMAFWYTSIEGMSIEEAAKKLQTRAGNIYFGRSRVMARIKRIVQRLEGREAQA
jgi:RNA polymerase sigma-70 factor, ECF subfamily